ncbi:hypothetical protein ACIOG7_08815 [Streptomyces sp. NPDC087894]|uniref:hypothetical protein n=1 Tax=Streptomyces sp. NPDC087894 TaxID=3365816 RepID=UPI0037F9B699
MANGYAVAGGSVAGPEAAQVVPLAWAPQESHAPVGADAVPFALPRFTLRTKIRITDQPAALGVRGGTPPHP